MPFASIKNWTCSGAHGTLSNKVSSNRDRTAECWHRRRTGIARISAVNKRELAELV